MRSNSRDPKPEIQQIDKHKNIEQQKTINEIQCSRSKNHDPKLEIHNLYPKSIHQIKNNDKIQK